MGQGGQNIQVTAFTKVTKLEKIWVGFETKAHTNMTDQGIHVVHAVRVWLNQTQTWINTQVTQHPSSVENHVVCHRAKNLDQFPLADLLILDQDGPLWRLLGTRSWRIRKRRHFQRVNDVVRKNGAQVLHSHFGNHGWENMELAQHTGLKHVVTFYGYDAGILPQVDPAWRDRYRALFAEVDLVLCEGPHFRKSLMELGCPGEKVHVQHLGVDLNKIPYRPRRWQPGEPLKVLLSGSFVEKKGLPFAFRALGQIKEEAHLEISVIGDDNGGERSKQEKATILAAVTDGGLDSHTRFLGYQPYSVLMKEAYNNHLFLSPSVSASNGDTEGGAPVTIIEMAASGMPIVSSFHCDIPEVIEDGKSGLLVPERDVDALADQLSWLIEHPDRWSAMVDAAREHIGKEFDSVIQGERLADQYRSLVLPGT